MSREEFVLTLIFFVVAVPVVLGVVSDMFRRWLKVREKEIDRAGGAAADRIAAQQAQIERLEQRVRVLERIATDQGAALAAEIENLPPLPAREAPRIGQEA
jgi:hypothetical protein